MSDKPKYVEIKARTRAELERSFASGDPNAVCDALYSAAQHERDWRWSQTQCLKMLNHESLLVRSSALIALGEIALFRGNLDLDVVLPEMKRFENDPALVLLSKAHSTTSGWQTLGRPKAGNGTNLITGNATYRALTSRQPLGRDANNRCDVSVSYLCMKKEESYRLAIFFLVLRPLALILASLSVSAICVQAQRSTAATPASGTANFLPIESSRGIVALKERLQSGDNRALAEFWQEVARTGTPLIEPAPDNPHQVIVTFLWRGVASTQGVGLLAPLQNSPGMPNFPLNRLLKTDLWFKCFRMRDDLRFTYSFLPNAKPNEEDAGQDATIDPLNPHRMEVAYDEGIAPTEFSIAAMPNALDESWIVKQPDVPAGKVERFQLKSALLGKEREISVYTPPGYSDKPKSEYWLLVLFDGFFYRSSIPTPTILDNLIHAGKVPPMVAVLIDNPRESRVSELGYSQPFVEFLSKEVLPWIRERWNVTHDPRKCIVGGLSMGGSEAAFVAMRHPEEFGKILSQSGSFADGNGSDVKREWLSSQYKASPKLPLRFFIEEGRLEDVSREEPTGLVANRHFVEILTSKGYPTTYEEVGGSHEPVQWRGALAEGLISLTK